MKKFYRIILMPMFIALTFSTCKTIPGQVHTNPAQKLITEIAGGLIVPPGLIIAVSDFPDLEGNLRQYSIYLSEELISHLHKTGKYTVIERKNLDKIIKEQQLSASELFDPAYMATIGRLTGANAIICGSLTRLNNKIKINARMLQVETAEVLATATALVDVDVIIDPLWEKVITPADSSENPIRIADNNLMRAVRQCINKPAGILTARDMQQVIHLNAWDARILNLEGLEHCRNLITLGLSNRVWGNQNAENDNIIRDLQPISDLPYLENIYLHSCRINNDPLVLKQLFAGWPALRELDLSRNNILNLDFLLPGTPLKALYLDGNENLEGLEPLLNFPTLKYLHLGGIAMDPAKLAIIAQLRGLTALQFWGTGITGLDFLEKLVNLVKLDIGANPLTDISVLLRLHEQGAFPAGSLIILTGCGLDLQPGTVNREVVDALTAAGVVVESNMGNVWQ